MNKTQKGAWVSLAMVVFCIAVLVYLFVEIFILNRIPKEAAGALWVPIVFCLLMVIATIFLRRKQSPAEVDADERDNLIKNRAVLTSFVSVWILLAAVAIIPRFVVGIEGSIPVWLLAFMNLGVLFGAGLVYSVAVLVQYGWRGKDGKK